MKTKEYTIAELDKKLTDDLMSCTSDFERGLCKAIGGKEIRFKAIDLQQKGALTSYHANIAAKYGYRPVQLEEGAK